jgi:hypothetical protein
VGMICVPNPTASPDSVGIFIQPNSTTTLLRSPSASGTKSALGPISH